MVSGFFTSPLDQARISSAVAKPMRNSSNTFTSCKVPYLTSGESVKQVRALDFVNVGGRIGPGSEVDTKIIGHGVHVLIGVSHVHNLTVSG